MKSFDLSDETNSIAFVTTAYEPSLEIFEADYRTNEPCECKQQSMSAVWRKQNIWGNHFHSGFRQRNRCGSPCPGHDLLPMRRRMD